MSGKINRAAIVNEFSPVMTDWNAFSPLSLGNGDFAFTADLTGLQTFPDVYEKAMPLATMANWGWHTSPFSADMPAVSHSAQKRTNYFNGERDVPYLTVPAGNRDEYNWLRQNPHKYNLARVGMRFAKETSPGDLRGIRQELNLLDGSIESRFTLDGEVVTVKTCVRPDRDSLAVILSGEPVKRGLGIVIELPAPSPNPPAGDYSRSGDHHSALLRTDGGTFGIARVMDGDRCFISVKAPECSALKAGMHRYEFTTQGETLEMEIAFSPVRFAAVSQSADDAFSASMAYWNEFWLTGGFFSAAENGPDGRELTRRVILSRYLTAIQCSGSLPPAETGLTTNSWYGKFHLEMHWWHAAHFPLWGKPDLLKRSMWYYLSILPRARALAAEQGFPGARWPKMTDPSGLDSPSGVGPLLIWQQPHPIFYAELLYRAEPTAEILGMMGEIVEESARFMAAYARKEGGRYVLGPGMIPAQENHKPHDAFNPAFELEYWAFALKIAAQWQKRLGVPVNGSYAEIANNMAKPTVLDGVYIAHENCPLTFEPPFNSDHPSMTAALGVLPGSLIDIPAMSATLDKITQSWQLSEGTWGWDFPTLAMCAARAGRPSDAVKFLLYDARKNEYLPNGHNKQADRGDLPLYLPGNGGLLYAVALMAAGWDGADRPNPGFPEDWRIDWEDISPAP